MAFEKGNRPDSPMKRRGGRRNMFLREEKSFREESQETVQNIRELLQ